MSAAMPASSPRWGSLLSSLSGRRRLLGGLASLRGGARAGGLARRRAPLRRRLPPRGPTGLLCQRLVGGGGVSLASERALGGGGAPRGGFARRGALTDFDI